MIKEKNPIFEQEDQGKAKDMFNPVKILGNLLKDLAKKQSRKKDDDSGSIRSGLKSRRGAPSTKSK